MVSSGSPVEQPHAHLARPEGGLYVALVSVHGRIRGHDLELGLEPDTGGQTRYVVELTHALARRPEIALVELFTRRIVDPDADPDYAQPIEEIGPKARIVRVDAGPAGFIRKEELWDHLDSFADNLLSLLRTRDRLPDVVHAHYADAGYVGARLANGTGCPLVFTGHSLGRVKRRRLLASGASKQEIEERYNITRRVEAEEETLAVAELVITSTGQEIREQYAFYDQYRPERMRVIPPGLDLERFHADGIADDPSYLESELARFLRRPELPMVLAIARPDERKNLTALVHAFGENEELREKSNLVILAGNRDDLREMDEQVRKVISGLLISVDVQDLYGHVAVPKHHRSDDVPLYYRLAARRHGVFVNPALTEPFGLTLLEAAACGLPIVATKDGGPPEILQHCRNGLLVDPLDTDDIARAISALVGDSDEWSRCSRNGIEGVREHYSWAAHARACVGAFVELPERREPVASPHVIHAGHMGSDRAVFTDIDQNLLGDPPGIKRFANVMAEHRARVAFGIATSRKLSLALKFLREQRIPQPDVLITSLGADIHYSPALTRDTAWREHIDHQWNARAVRRTLAEVPGIELQPRVDQDDFKISYFVDSELAPGLDEIVSLLRSADQAVNVFLSFGKFLDVVPIRASKGAAIRYVCEQWNIPIERVLAAGGSGADEDMMRGNTLAVVVANRHKEELSQLVDLERIYFARKGHADGILEAIQHYDFLGHCEALAG